MIKPINFYCQKILPLVYDDSLSYYEVLCKVIDKLNEIIIAYNQLLETGLTDEIDKYLNSILINAIYDEKTETITLKKEISVTNASHVYDGNSKSLIIKDSEGSNE